MARIKDSRKDTDVFKYTNVNPKGWKTTGDCVVRAIACATNQAWDDVYEALCQIGAAMKRMPNDDKVYTNYLQKLCIPKSPQPRKPNNKKYTIEEFAKYSRPNDTYIIRTANHLTVIKNGKIHDTWNCGDYCVGNYWTIH